MTSFRSVPTPRFKCVIGDALRSRPDRRRATEVGVTVYALNRTLELGRTT